MINIHFNIIKGTICDASARCTKDLSFIKHKRLKNRQQNMCTNNQMIAI